MKNISRKRIQTRRMRMIEIVKHGKKNYTFRCDSCGCEFTTDGAEIFREKRINGKAWIYCPECGAQISVGHVDDADDIVKKQIYC